MNNTIQPTSSTPKLKPLQNISFKSKHTPLQNPVTIKNFHQVDEYLLRGGKPTEAQIKELKNNGVKSIISFCTNYNPLKPTAKTIPDEAAWAQKEGIKFYWMPLIAKKNPSREYIQNFLNITNNARKNGEQVFIHCRHGADRTGLFSAIYRLTNHNVKLSDVIRELMKFGHDANHHPNIIPFIIDFKESLSPLNKLKNFAENGLKNLVKTLKK